MPDGASEVKETAHAAENRESAMEEIPMALFLWRSLW